MAPASLPDQQRVGAVEVGINTLATASIVTPDGTVAARGFFHPAADMDRRDKRATLIRRKDGQLSVGKSSPGKPRMPVTLSTLWQREPEAPHRCTA